MHGIYCNYPGQSIKRKGVERYFKENFLERLSQDYVINFYHESTNPLKLKDLE